jgi:hypothetical protein
MNNLISEFSLICNTYLPLIKILTSTDVSFKILIQNKVKGNSE